MCAKNYENWPTVDNVIAKISRLTFFGPPCIFIYSAHIVSVDIMPHTAVGFRQAADTGRSGAVLLHQPGMSDGR